MGGHGTQTSSEFHAEVRGVNGVKDTIAGGGSITSPCEGDMWMMHGGQIPCTAFRSFFKHKKLNI